MSFTKSKLKRFIYETLIRYGNNPELYSAHGVAETINSRVDMFCEPFEKWINTDGDPDNIVLLIDEVIR